MPTCKRDRITAAKCLRVPFAAALGLAFLLGAPGSAFAQGEYPHKPIRVILPFATGGPGDMVMRKLIGPEMSARLGQPLVMDNVVGGTGFVGQEQAARSAPDGYTTVVVSISAALNYHFLKRTLDFHKDFATIGQIYAQYGLIVTNHKLPEMAGIHTLKDLLAYAKANPGKLNYASQGTGSVGHLTMERLKSMIGVQIEHVPYRGSGPAYVDLLAGHIQLMSSSLGALPYIRSGRLRPIAISSQTRSGQIPEVGTFVEGGVDFVGSSWFGMAAPPGTPKPIIDRWAAELKATIAKPEVAEGLRQLGTEPEFLGPAEFATRATNDFEAWGRVIRDANIKPD